MTATTTTTQTTATETPIKLNLGCGAYKIASWVNIDSVADFQPDMQFDATDPALLLDRFALESVDAIYAGHLLEHIADPLLALRTWYSLLKPGGEICITMPDHGKAVELWMNGEPFPVLTDNPLTGILAVATGFYSWQQCQAMRTANPAMAAAQQHRRALDFPVLKALMEFAGFTGLARIDESQYEAAPKFTQPVTWQMVIRGKKPE